MITFFKSPVIRISFGILAITLSLVISGYLIGLVPDKAQAVFDARKRLSQSLAVQFTLDARQGNTSQTKQAMAILVDRNPEVLSVAVRTIGGEIMTVAGDHKGNWRRPSEGQSTLEHVQVPVFKGNEKWGFIEISFAPIRGYGVIEYAKNSIWGILVFILCVGFLAYTLFLKRVLKELDPTAVIPERVKAAFDALAEGVFILDESEKIVLANSAFCSITGMEFDAIVGRKASSMNWQKTSYKQLDKSWQLPWLQVLKEGVTQKDERLILADPHKKEHIFMVNCSPILDSRGQNKGVLTTFDDVSQLEEKNLAMQDMLKKLEKSKSDISRQNDQLKILVEQDPLTACYNRRALHAQFKGLFDSSIANNTRLSCIMIDIDHFKSINDNFGHQTGDKVIKLVAEIIKENLRDSDIVGRYGGEEYCVVLPDLNDAEVLDVAERIRTSILESKEYRPLGPKKVTASLGVAALKDDIESTDQLIGQADKALYIAKNSGRNRVAVWNNASHLASVNTKATEINISHEIVELKEQKKAIAKWETTAEVESFIQESYRGEGHIVLHDMERSLKFDPTTGLPGRILFYDRLKSAVARAKRSGDNVAVFSISFQMYKRIQNALGHDAAEQLIVKIVRKISAVLRETDTLFLDPDKENTDPILSRQDREGFYLLLPELKDDRVIPSIVQRIQKSFSTPLTIEEFNLKINSKIGVSVYPVDSNEPDQLIKYADIALHHAQASIRHNACQFYSEEMNQQFEHQLEIESELLRAMEQDELELYYQPLLNLSNGNITSFEVLVRWNHPEKGILSANSFIDVAEQCGFILTIGDWVLRTAIKQLAAWLEDTSENIAISVNLSALQLQQHDLSDTIIGYLQDNGVSGRHLMLEITESTIVENMVCAVQVMEKLRDFEVRIAIDDFGTGYSSLQHIQKLPIDVLKIDRSFVKDIETNKTDVGIVSAITDMAKQLNLATVVEGVETETQFNIIRELNCNNIQGYLISRPISCDKVTDMLLHKRYKAVIE